MTNQSSSKCYIVSAKRTPFGKYGGSLKDINPVELAFIASKAAMDDLKMEPDHVDHVIAANVITSTTDTIYMPRHVSLMLGLPIQVPGYTVNRLCGSGIQAVLDAKRLIDLGEASLVLAFGSENMSMVPHLTYGARFGTRYGSLKSVDMLLDTLTDKYTDLPMAITAENLAKQYNISREESDEFSAKSHQKANQAKDFIQQQIVPVHHKKISLDFDEHIRDNVSLEDMSKLKPSFQTNGVVTAGSASGIVDGASAIFIASEQFVKENNLSPLAEIVDGHVVGVKPEVMGIGPVPTIQKLLSRNNMSLEQIDLIEINEAFSAQVLACQKELKIPEDKLNIWGGAIAIGHPLAATGTRIIHNAAHQLSSLDKEFSIASACIGGGQGISLLLKRA